MKALTIALAVLVPLLLAEIGLRIRYAIVDTDPAAALARSATRMPPPFAGGCGPGAPQAYLGDLVRPSVRPGVIYELKPELDTCFYGARVTTNAEGLRAPRSYARPKPPGTYRVLLLGDSQTFGQGVELEDTWGARIEAALGARSAGTRVEVVNTGVDGYNTAQQAAVLAASGMSYEPDCVLILFTDNDIELPAFLLNRRDPLTLERSYLGAQIEALLGRRPPLSAIEDGAPLRLPDEDRIPPEYAHMVGIDGYLRAMERIAETAGAASVPVVNFARSTGDADWRQGREHQRTLGIVLPEFELPWEPRFWLSEENRHANPAGHVVIAERMLGGLERHGVCLPPA